MLMTLLKGEKLEEFSSCSSIGNSKTLLYPNNLEKSIGPRISGANSQKCYWPLPLGGHWKRIAPHSSLLFLKSLPVPWVLRGKAAPSTSSRPCCWQVIVLRHVFFIGIFMSSHHTRKFWHVKLFCFIVTFICLIISMAKGSAYIEQGKRTLICDVCMAHVKSFHWNFHVFSAHL